MLDQLRVKRCTLQVTDLGVVYQLIGGLTGSTLVFLLPGALLLTRPPAQGWPTGSGGTVGSAQRADAEQPLLGYEGRGGYASWQRREAVPPEEGAVARAARLAAGGALMFMGLLTVAATVYAVAF